MGAEGTDWLYGRMREFGGRPCLVRGGETVTYAEMAALAERFEKVLGEKGVSTLLLRGDYTPTAVALLLACARQGVVVAPMLSDHRESMDAYAAAFGADWSVVESAGDLLWEPLTHEAERPVLVRELQEKGRSGLVLFSSGSTGQPKAMMHDFANFLSQYEDRRPKKLSILLFLLFDHIGGLNTLFGSLAAGMKLVAPERRDAETVAHLVSKHRVAVLPTTPTFLNLLLLNGLGGDARLATLRVVTYGAERMPDALLTRVKAAFPRAKLIQTFGTSETGISRTSQAGAGSNRLRLDDPDREFKIVEGELWLRSRTQVLGYLNADNSRFTEDGWFKTGDLVEVQEDGSLKVLNRKSELINVGGEKVFPSEVEAVVLELEEVVDCVVHGAPNPITGESVAVEVVVRKDLEPARVRSLVRNHVRSRLQRHKVPTKITVSRDLQMTDRFKRKAVRSPGSRSVNPNQG